jgi:hypothetical protein
LRELGGVDFRGSVNFELLLLLSASVLILSFPYLSELFLALFVILLVFAAFLALCWLLWFFPLLDDLLELLLAFWVF